MSEIELREQFLAAVRDVERLAFDLRAWASAKYDVLPGAAEGLEAAKAKAFELWFKLQRAIRRPESLRRRRERKRG